MNLRHQRILASAGSGKTYQLAARFLTLLVHGADVSTILASTFTRQAAGQIARRILLRLVEASETREALMALRRDTQKPDLSHAEVLRILKDLAKSLHRLRVRTLDSVLSSIVTAFALDLGLPPGLEVADEVEEERLRHAAIDAMLDAADTDRFADLLRQLTEDQPLREVVKAVVSAVRDAHELWRESTGSAWEVIAGRPKPELEVVEHTAIHLASIVEGSEARLGKTVAADAAAVQRGNWFKFLDSGVVKAVLRDGRYYSKSLPSEVVSAYRILIEQAERVTAPRMRARSMAIRDLVADFDRHLRIVKHEEGLVTFSDLGVVLREADEMALEDIYFRLDGRVEHILLDEFQDTSVPQWMALAPMVREAASYAPPSRSLFVVGDLKQSIYGWRAGEPEILARLPEALGGPGSIEDIVLSRSYRSDPEIINVVNDVFGTIATNVALASNSEAARAWSEWFEEHQPSLQPRSQGYFEIKGVKADSSKPNAATKLRAKVKESLALIETLLSTNSGISVGVLMRNNHEVTVFMNEVASAGRGGLAGIVGQGRVADSTGVNLILDALRMIDHPGDTISAFNVSQSPLGDAMGMDRVWSSMTPDRCSVVARQWRRRILQNGLGVVVAQWAKVLAPFGDERDARRLRQITQIATRFHRRGGVRMSEFVRMAEECRLKESTTAKVQAMTVHQAKGLEFDAVILPSLDAPIDQHRDQLVYRRDNPLGPITAISISGRRGERAIIPEVEHLYEHARFRSVREELCSLYVGLTRAKSAMYLIVDDQGESHSAEPRCTGQEVIRAALNVNAGAGVLCTRGDPQWLSHMESREAACADDEVAFVPPRSGRVRPRIRRPSGTEGIVAGDADRRDEGIAMHLLLSRVEWLESFSETDAELMSMLEGELPRKDRNWAVGQVAAFRRAVACPQIAVLLSRPSADAVVWRERRYAVLVDGELNAGAIDRLVYRPNDGSVEIVDFKTMAPDPGRTGEWFETQLTAYREAAVSMLGVKREAVRLRIAFVSVGIVMEICRENAPATMAHDS